jgi:hypothetical protein
VPESKKEKELFPSQKVNAFCKVTAFENNIIGINGINCPQIIISLNLQLFIIDEKKI